MSSNMKSMIADAQKVRDALSAALSEHDMVYIDGLDKTLNVSNAMIQSIIKEFGDDVKICYLQDELEEAFSPILRILIKSDFDFFDAFSNHQEGTIYTITA